MSPHSVWLVEYGYVDRFPASNLFAGRHHHAADAQPLRPRRLRRAVRRGAPVHPARGDRPVPGGAETAAAVRVPDAQLRADAARRPRSTRPGRPPDARRRPARGGGEHISLLPAFDTHTAGSQYVLLDDEASGPWLFAGDNVYVYENIEGLRGDGVYAPISMATGSPTTWLSVTDDVLRSVGGATGRVLPFHDNAVWQRFPSREYSDGLHVAEVALGPGHASVLAHDSA